MSKYQCKNKKCPTYNVEVVERGVHIKYNSDGSQTDVKAICPECKSIRKLIEGDPEKDGLCTHMYSDSGNLCKK